jgi:CHAD domain-containing protein
MTRPSAGPTPALADHLDRRVDELRQHVPKAVRGADVTAIHQARVSTRRLKAALDLLEPLLPEQSRRRFARALRRLRRTLGPSRDVDVMLAHLPDLRPRRGRCDAVDWLRRRLTERRDELARERAKAGKVAQVLGELDGWPALSRRIARANGQARALLVTTAPRLASEFAGQATRVARLDLEASCEAAEDVHALRVSGKILRYMLELAEPAGIELPRTVLRKFKRLQDALGLWHDYAALGEQVLRFAVRDELGLHRPALYGEVLELARACWRKSNANLRAFGRTWTRDGEAMVRSINDALAPEPHERPVEVQPLVIVEEPAGAPS